MFKFGQSMPTITTTTTMEASGSQIDETRSTSNANDATVAELSIDDCVYKGEGNANIVIALPSEGNVIRFRKSTTEKQTPDMTLARVKLEVEFVRHVVSKYLDTYVRIPEILRYDAQDIAKLSAAIRRHRPVKRQHKDIAQVYVTKLPDYTLLSLNSKTVKLKPSWFTSESTFSVEIKPKQGYLLKTERRLQKCPYCLTQYHKLDRKDIVTRSTYCPFDLFSGEASRMKRAIKGLLKAPQNNLNLFKDGVMVYGQGSVCSNPESILAEWFRNGDVRIEETSYVGLFCDFLCNALLHPYSCSSSRETRVNGYNQIHRNSSHRNSRKMSPTVDADLISKANKLLYHVQERCDYENQDLIKGSVLERILSMQRLPYVDKKHVYDIYERYSTSLTHELIYSNMINSFKAQKSTNSQDFLNRRTKEEQCLSYSSLSKYEEDLNENQYFKKEEDPTWLRNVDVATESRINESTLRTGNRSLNRRYVSNGCNEAAHREQKDTNSVLNMEDLLVLQNYLLFSVARDCSIFVTFRQLNPDAVLAVPSEYVMKTSEGLYFLTTINISDLDPKNVQCIEKHHQRDINVLKSVISVLTRELSIKS